MDGDSCFKETIQESHKGKQNNDDITIKVHLIQSKRRGGTISRGGQKTLARGTEYTILSPGPFKRGTEFPVTTAQT